MYAASDDLRFAAAVAAFGMVLRASEHRGASTLELAESLARTSVGEDEARAEFLELLARARELTPADEVAQADESGR